MFYCRVIERRTQVKRMWVIDNSENVLDDIELINSEHNAKNINTFDFSTLYTNLPHEDLKDKIKWAIENVSRITRTKRCILLTEERAGGRRKLRMVRHSLIIKRR